MSVYTPSNPVRDLVTALVAAFVAADARATARAKRALFQSNDLHDGDVYLMLEELLACQDLDQETVDRVVIALMDVSERRAAATQAIRADYVALLGMGRL